MLQPIIIAGGSGTRLWPLSRKSYSKQFLPLVGTQSMLQATIARLEALSCLPPIVVCNEEHRFIAAEQLREMAIEQQAIILEPCALNTAPAVCLAALLANETNAKDNLLILPADHHMGKPEDFCAGVKRSELDADAGNLITFGITPSEPATGYGYIKARIDSSLPTDIHEFIEKPCYADAVNFVASANYLWNSGIFLCSSDTYLSELEKHRPEIFSACVSAWQKRRIYGDFTRPDNSEFMRCPAESIDYAIMEHTDCAKVTAIDPDWNDLGSWSSLHELLPKTSQGNVHSGDVLSVDSANNYIHSGHRLVTALGINDLVIVDTKDALLVAHKDKAQEIKSIVEQLDSQQRPESIHHREVFRPWGKYDAMDSAERFQVKRITVKPMAKLSVQMHHHRAEHWVVVKGTAKVTIDGVESLVSENESVYIPIGAVHALENPGKIAIELIEIQTGSYLGEDDIVRLEDRYGRT